MHLIPTTASIPATDQTDDGDRPAQDLDVRGIMATIRRRWRAVALTAILVMLALGTFVFTVSPRYTAEATLFVDPRRTNVTDFGSVVSAFPPEQTVVHSEGELLQAPALASEVVAQLDLVHNPDFNIALRRDPAEGSWLPSPEAIWRIFAVASSHLGLEQFMPAAPEPARPETEQETALRLADEILNHLTVIDTGRSYVIRARFDWYTPELAARVLTSLTELHLRDQLRVKVDATKRANVWLTSRIGELRDDLRKSEKALQDFREQHQLSEAKGSTVVAQQLSELNSQLVLATSERAQKEAALASAKGVGGDGSDSLSPVLQSALVQRLQGQIADLQNRLADLSNTYGERHPSVVSMRQQLKDLQSKIALETRKIVTSLSNDLASARTRENQLRTNLARVQATAAQTDRATQTAQELARDADANRELLQSLLMRAKETSLSADIEQPDTRMVSPPIVPRVPSFPKKPLFLGLGAVVALLGGVLVALLMERLTRRFANSAALERAAQVRVVGVVPEMRTNRETLAEHVLRQPRSPIGEAIRSIKTALYLTIGDTASKIVLFTSALPNEGKTMLAVSLARSIASGGRKVLLVDCDLRRPQVAEILGNTLEEGVISVLRDGDESGRMIGIDPYSGLHYIVAGRNNEDPQELLNSRNMQRFLEVVRPKYDVVLLDSPPVLAVSDALILSRLADLTVFLVRWDHTPRAAVMSALRQLRTAGANLSGVVLSRIDMRRKSDYGYVGGGMWEKECRHYYTE